MKKDDAEKAIRYMCGVWAEEKGIQRGSSEILIFGEFRSWADAKGYGHYFDFRSRMGSHHDAEMWFDEEMGQSSRN